MKLDQVRSSAEAPLPATVVPKPPAIPVAKKVDDRKPFCPIAFRRVLSDIMKELSQGWNVPAAVRRIREQGVPATHQAGEFADILTRAAEESRGAARRAAFAFAAGLAAAD